MYCYYAYTSGWTMSQVLSDIRLLCTGTTDKASLSASCNQTDTTITNTVAADWTSYDSDDGSVNGGWVISRNDATAVATKYFRVYSTSATVITSSTPESWNAGTNAATNASSITASMTMATAGTPGVLHVFATPDYIVIANGSYSAKVMCLEFDRDSAIVEGTVPCWGVGDHFNSQTSTLNLPKLHDPVGTTFLTTTSAKLRYGGIVAMASASTTAGGRGLTSVQTKASDNSSFMTLSPIFAVWESGDLNPRSLPIGKLRGPMFLLGTATALDTLTYNSKQWLMPALSAAYPAILFPLE